LRRRYPTAVCVGLAALGLRSAGRDHYPAVPHRAGQAQHPWPQRRARFQPRDKTQAPKGLRCSGGKAGHFLMSIPEQTKAAALGADFVEAAERALHSGLLEQVSDAELERVMTAAVRLYAAKSESENATVRPVTPEGVTPTEVVVTVSGLIRGAGLN